MPLVIPVEGAGLRVVSGLVATAAAVRLFLVVALHLLGGALHAPAHAIECLVLVWGWWGVVVVIGVGSVSVKVVGLGVCVWWVWWGLGDSHSIYSRFKNNIQYVKERNLSKWPTLDSLG